MIPCYLGLGLAYSNYVTWFTQWHANFLLSLICNPSIKSRKNFFYSFLQIKDFFTTRTPQTTLDIPTDFELLCSRGPYESHLFSYIYKILHATPSITEQSHSYMWKWSHILHRLISLDEWRKIWDVTSKVSRCVAQKKTAYKILMFWYRTLEFLMTQKLTLSGQCWRCSSSLRYPLPYILGMSYDHTLLVTSPQSFGKSPRHSNTSPPYTPPPGSTPSENTYTPQETDGIYFTGS